MQVFVNSLDVMNAFTNAGTSIPSQTRIAQPDRGIATPLAGSTDGSEEGAGLEGRGGRHKREKHHTLALQNCNTQNRLHVNTKLT